MLECYRRAGCPGSARANQKAVHSTPTRPALCATLLNTAAHLRIGAAVRLQSFARAASRTQRMSHSMMSLSDESEWDSGEEEEDDVIEDLKSITRSHLLKKENLIISNQCKPYLFLFTTKIFDSLGILTYKSLANGLVITEKLQSSYFCK